MLNKSVARRYAEAFFAIAQDKNKIDEFQKELEEITSAMSTVGELKVFLRHVSIPPQEKKAMLAQIFNGKVSVETLNFIDLVIDKRRGEYIEAIVEEYKNMADDYHNVLKAEFYSVREIDNQEIAQLEKTLSDATGKIVRLNLIVEPQLIGGVKVKIGDRVIDASIIKKIKMLESNLKRVKIS